VSQVGPAVTEPAVTKLLVANRGEIARRVTKTARAMGIRTVAVFSEPDEHAPFVREADEAVALGGSAARDTYLDGAKLIEAARRTGCDSVHPGYGFLSENAPFASACAASGLVFVGPPPEVIASMASKVASKELMSAAGVPVVPGEAVAPADRRDPRHLLTSAERVGYPLLVKAAFGGGGRGMRVVAAEEDLLEAVESAERESQASFGEGTVFLERWLESPRHVEVQVLGDAYGSIAQLFERECSIQRRHQKLIEETPSPAVDTALRAELGEAALAGAKAIGYVGAGTVELLLDSAGGYYFLEMNTRIQVEHPVTEMVTGLDIVELQIRVAQGEELPGEVLSASLSGHAIEARLYAEDVDKGFLPVSGRVERLGIAAGPGIRVDSGYEDGSEVSSSYDALLAKVVAWAPTREEAAQRLSGALAASRLHGVTTNRDLLVAVLRDPEFVAGRTDTGFLERRSAALAGNRARLEERRRLHAAAAALASQAERHERRAVQPHVPSGWRNVPAQPVPTVFEDGAGRIEVSCRIDRGGLALAVDGTSLDGARLWSATAGSVDLAVGGVRRQFEVERRGRRHFVDSALGSSDLLELERFPAPAPVVAAGSLLAPLPGTVTRVSGHPGERVEAGQTLVVIEAMKMEHQVRAPRDGNLARICVEVSQQVEAGAVLAVLDEGDVGG
jgi:propionyl-CoA carboxylase alpha chain